ncbi:MAG TPA: hypothetical protein V6D29_01900 [Leptolyngbyaceae cyanobacterium]
MADEALVRELLGAVKAYTQQYGVPESVEQLQGLASSLLRLKAQADATALQAKDAEALIHRVTTDFGRQSLTDLAIDIAQQVLAQQAYEWQESLSTKIQETLSAYIQYFAPGKTPDDLNGTIESIIPLVLDGNITRAEVIALVQQVASRFRLYAALAQVIKPEYRKAAQELAICIAQKSMEEAVKETVLAYAEKYQPAMETLSEKLIENAIAAITNLPIEFDWVAELNLKDKRLLIKQVTFKLNILKADQVPSGAAQQAANQLHNEIERFRQERKASLGTVDITEGLSSNDDLEISSGLKFTGPAQP